MDFIDEMRMEETPDVEDTETQDEVQSESETVVEDTQSKEESSTTEMDNLKAQIAGMEKRIADKDDFINTLKQNNVEETQETPDEEDDFWSDPSKKFQEQQQQLEAMQFQVNEQNYARQHNDYFDVVSVDAVNVAMAQDSKFAEEFNGSTNKFDTAYTYLKEQSTKAVNADDNLRETIRKELMEEMGVKAPSKAPKSVGSIGGSSNTKSDASEDGFMTVFG